MAMMFALTTLSLAITYDMPVYNPSTDASYEILAPSTWEDAESTAVSRGGHLTSIHSEAENNFIRGMISFFSWLGLNQPPGSLEPGGGWVWSDGTAVNYTNWAIDEPNDYLGGNENVAEMTAPALWNDRTSAGPLPGVAKYAGFRGGVINPANGHHYYLVGGGDWIQIESWAVNLFGGHLVTINDAAEQAWLESVFGTDTLYWIGMNDVNNEGNWEWVSGEPVTYTNWADGEPNNYGGVEDYAVMNWGVGYWNDVWIGSPFITVGIVEVVPKPITIDIKPGSFPNSINLKSKGVVPVAVLATDDFDASTVDPGTVEFAWAPPIRWTMEDVNGDGRPDMLFHFDTQALGLTQGSTEAILTGYTNGAIPLPVEGTDSVNIVPKSKGKDK